MQTLWATAFAFGVVTAWVMLGAFGDLRSASELEPCVPLLLLFPAAALFSAVREPRVQLALHYCVFVGVWLAPSLTRFQEEEEPTQAQLDMLVTACVTAFAASALVVMSVA